MRWIGLVGLSFTAACMTDPNGDSCVWAPGGDGFCPSDSGGGDPPPSFHTFGDPRFLEVGGQVRLLVRSSGEDYDAREELALVSELPDALPERSNLYFNAERHLATACSAVCVAAWKDLTDRKIRSAVRDAAGWSSPTAHEGASRAPAVATAGELVLVAWSTWETDVGARVELRVLERDGRVRAAHTLARGVSHGHLSLAAGPDGALVTWERGEPSTLGPDGQWQTHAWLVAQPLGRDGAPVGEPLEQAVTRGDQDYYEAAPAAFVDGRYRVVHGALPDGATWVVVDPVARTTALATIGTLAWPRQVASIVPLAEGAVLGVSGDGGSIIRVANEVIANELVLPGDENGAPAVLPTAGGFQLAYAYEGSLYREERAADLGPATEPALLAEAYEIESGCRTGGGHGLGAIVLLVGLLVRRRRGTLRPCSGTTCA